MSSTLVTHAVPVLASPGQTDLPPRQSCALVRVTSGDALCRMLDRYIVLGYDIERACDGWVLLRAGDDRVALTTTARHR